MDDGIVQQSHATYATDAQRDAFLQWWTSTDAPRFGWLAFSGAHTPFDPPPGNVPTGSTRGDYLQVVGYLNEALATVLGSIDLSETFVIVFTDNGTPDDARPTGAPSGVWKGSTFEGGVNVPLLIAGPGIHTGTSDRLVSMVDVPATLLELLDSRSRGFEDSVSFADELGSWGGSARRSWVFTERFAVDASLSGSPQPEGYDDQAVIEAHWKLRRVDEDGVGPEPARDRFYHLPGELPLLPPTQIRTRLRAALESLPPRP